MVVKLFINNSDTRTVSKSLTSVATYDCTVKYPCDILSPTLLIHDTANNVARANYVYIQDWGRYYYATVTATPTMWELSCNVDALMSWRGSIRNLNTYIERQEYEYNLYITDPLLPVRSERGLSYQAVGSIGDNKSTILTVTGGNLYA